MSRLGGACCVACDAMSPPPPRSPPAGVCPRRRGHTIRLIRPTSILPRGWVFRMMSEMLIELAFADATELAELIRRGEVTPRELVSASIARIEALNPRLNAVVTPMYEQALRAAEQVDPQAPFAGVPMLVKDLLARCAGVRNTNGSRLLAEHVARSDSELVARLRRAGLVPVGLTSTSELGRAPITEGGLFGATRNPWDTELSTAGSSGGSAAAVAAGIVPLAHGHDTGRSARQPGS